VERCTLINILFGWFLTPTIATVIVLSFYFAIHLRYVLRVDNTEIARLLNGKEFKTKTGRIWSYATLKTEIRKHNFIT